MARVVLFDVDSRIPNLALMKLSAYYKARGWEVVLSRKPIQFDADQYGDRGRLQLRIELTAGELSSTIVGEQSSRDHTYGT